jgi:hypothetical protein
MSLWLTRGPAASSCAHEPHRTYSPVFNGGKPFVRRLSRVVKRSRALTPVKVIIGSTRGRVVCEFARVYLSHLTAGKISVKYIRSFLPLALSPTSIRLDCIQPLQKMSKNAGARTNLARSSSRRRSSSGPQRAASHSVSARRFSSIANGHERHNTDGDGDGDAIITVSSILPPLSLSSRVVYPQFVCLSGSECLFVDFFPARTDTLRTAWPSSFDVVERADKLRNSCRKERF